MDDDHGSAIPAANIGETDLIALTQTNPDAAREIARLEDLMNRGEETAEEVRRLCQLLSDVGSFSAAEYLLRRNLEYYEGRALYTQLFGTAKQDEFQSAVAAFKAQFNLELILVAQNDFLVSTFHADAGPPRSDAFALLSRPCEIKIGYIEREVIEAGITLLDRRRNVFSADECMFMYFLNGVWEIADPMDA